MDAEEDVEAVLTWRALQDEDTHDDDTNTSACDGQLVAQQSSSTVEENARDINTTEDDDDFARLDDLPVYTEESDSGPPPLASPAADPLSTSSNLSQSLSSSRTGGVQPRLGRLKRKNFSKHLQFLCLQRYAKYIIKHGKLPERPECQALLNQSYAHFIQEGGSEDHPRLAYPEFLKLIRNRSRERQERLQKESAATTPHLQQSKTTSSSSLMLAPKVRRSGRNPGSQCGARQNSNNKKRTRTDEVAKIDELIRVIDKARGRGSIGSAAAQRTQDASESSSQTMAAAAVTLTVAAPMIDKPTHETPIHTVDAILHLQQDTLAVQHMIKERLASIQEQCRSHHEPSSASV